MRNKEYWSKWYIKAINNRDTELTLKQAFHAKDAYIDSLVEEIERLEGENEKSNKLLAIIFGYTPMSSQMVNVKELIRKHFENKEPNEEN